MNTPVLSKSLPLQSCTQSAGEDDWLATLGKRIACLTHSGQAERLPYNVAIMLPRLPRREPNSLNAARPGLDECEPLALSKAVVERAAP